MNIPALPSPTPELALVVNCARDELNAARAWTLRSASPAVLGRLFDAYSDALLRAGMGAPPALATWPRSEGRATPQTTGHQGRPTP